MADIPPIIDQEARASLGGPAQAYLKRVRALCAACVGDDEVRDLEVFLLAIGGLFDTIPQDRVPDPPKHPDATKLRIATLANLFVGIVAGWDEEDRMDATLFYAECMMTAMRSPAYRLFTESAGNA